MPSPVVFPPHPFHPLWTFSFSLLDKDHYWGYWKGVLIIYRRKHIKGRFSRPIRSMLKPSLVATPGLSMLLGAFNSFLCQKFFNYTWRKRFYCGRAQSCCYWLFFCETLNCRACKTRKLIICTLQASHNIIFTASALQLLLNGFIFQMHIFIIFVGLSAQSVSFQIFLWSFWEDSHSANR